MKRRSTVTGSKHYTKSKSADSDFLDHLRRGPRIAKELMAAIGVPKETFYWRVRKYLQQGRLLQFEAGEK